MKISIITVCFNAEKTIEETLISVTNQTYNNIEYIIIDGKSTDKTLDIIYKYKNKISFIVSEPDQGIYDAMNKGLQIATGDYVIFLGADDHLISFKIIEEIVPYLQKKDTIYYGSVFRPKSNTLYCGHFTKYKLAIKNIPHQSIFFPKIVYKDYPYKLEYKLLADYYNNIILFNKYSFKHINRTISFFNDTGVSAQNIDCNFNKIKNYLIIKELGILAFIYAKIFQLLRYIYKSI